MREVGGNDMAIRVDDARRVGQRHLLFESRFTQVTNGIGPEAVSVIEYPHIESPTE